MDIYFHGLLSLIILSVSYFSLGIAKDDRNFEDKCSEKTGGCELNISFTCDNNSTIFVYKYNLTSCQNNDCDNYNTSIHSCTCRKKCNQTINIANSDKNGSIIIEYSCILDENSTCNDTITVISLSPDATTTSIATVEPGSSSNTVSNTSTESLSSSDLPSSTDSQTSSSGVPTTVTSTNSCNESNGCDNVTNVTTSTSSSLVNGTSTEPSGSKEADIPMIKITIIAGAVTLVIVVIIIVIISCRRRALRSKMKIKCDMHGIVSNEHAQSVDADIDLINVVVVQNEYLDLINDAEEDGIYNEIPIETKTNDDENEYNTIELVTMKVHQDPLYNHLPHDADTSMSDSTYARTSTTRKHQISITETAQTSNYSHTVPIVNEVGDDTDNMYETLDNQTTSSKNNVSINNPSNLFSVPLVDGYRSSCEYDHTGSFKRMQEIDKAIDDQPHTAQNLLLNDTSVHTDDSCIPGLRDTNEAKAASIDTITMNNTEHDSCGTSTDDSVQNCSTRNRTVNNADDSSDSSDSSDREFDEPHTYFILEKVKREEDVPN